MIPHAKCWKESCLHGHGGESGIRMLEQIKDHNGRDTSSEAADHQFVVSVDLRISGRNSQNKWQRKIVAALLTKNLKPSLNVKRSQLRLNCLTDYVA